MYTEMEKAGIVYLEICEALSKSPVKINKAILCALMDFVAGREDKTGYELLMELEPMIEETSKTFGVMK